ncbi:MAG: transposase [Actinobacteria bacterium]|nr:transposase [Actinomycetota bacterium]
MRTGGASPPVRLPAALTQAQALHPRVEQALQRARREEGAQRLNLTDPDTVMVKSRQGTAPGYNAQAVVVPLAIAPGEPAGRLVTAVGVVAAASDAGQLPPLLAEATATTGQTAPVTLADGGCHAGPTVVAGAAAGTRLVMPESQRRALRSPYHKDRFAYQPATDSFLCPHGHALRYRHTKQRTGRPPARAYRAGAICRGCSGFGRRRHDWHQGRVLELGLSDPALRAHRTRMASAAAQRLAHRRSGLVEGGFGVLKEVMGARRFLLRGLANVHAEWALLATAFNLRRLWRVWRYTRRGGAPLRLIASPG